MLGLLLGWVGLSTVDLIAGDGDSWVKLEQANGAVTVLRMRGLEPRVNMKV